MLGKRGRLVIPAEIRAALDLHPGDRLRLHVADARLVLSPVEGAVTALRAFASAVPAERSLVEELLAERRLTTHE